MSFSSLVSELDAVVEDAFQDFVDSDGAPTLTIHSQGGGIPDYTISVTQSSPQFQDDYIPGASAVGPAILMLFVASGTYATLTHKPVKGDTASLSGVDYDVVEVPVDKMGAATLHLRKRNRRFDL